MLRKYFQRIYIYIYIYIYIWVGIHLVGSSGWLVPSPHWLLWLVGSSTSLSPSTSLVRPVGWLHALFRLIGFLHLIGSYDVELSCCRNVVANASRESVLVSGRCRCDCWCFVCVCSEYCMCDLFVSCYVVEISRELMVLRRVRVCKCCECC